MGWEPCHSGRENSCCFVEFDRGYIVWECRDLHGSSQSRGSVGVESQARLVILPVMSSDCSRKRWDQRGFWVISVDIE